MEVEHTRCLVDGHFGLIKKWQWRNWDILINSLFKSVTGIRKYHHFRVSSDSPGIVDAREKLDSEEVQISIFKRGVTAEKVRSTSLPNVIPAAGLSRDRAEYLYTQVRPFVRPAYQDITCPPMS